MSVPSVPANDPPHGRPDRSPHENRSLIEDEAPKDGPVIEILDLRDEVPKSTETVRSIPATHDQTTRKHLAYTVLGLIALLYGAAAAGLIFGALDQNGFALLITGLSGPQALGATVIGFYYGKKGK